MARHLLYTLARKTPAFRQGLEALRRPLLSPRAASQNFSTQNFSKGAQAGDGLRTGQPEKLDRNRSVGNIGALIIAGTLMLGGGAAGVYYRLGMQEEEAIKSQLAEDVIEEVANWSGTHVVEAPVARPESLEELEAVIREAHACGQRVRPLGSGISPNGLGLSGAGMVSLGQMDRVLHVDTEKRQVTVQAGARVEQVVEALRPHGLTLPNYASVREQQIGGFMQVSAHGTGARIPPVDEQVVAVKLVTPAQGTLELSATSHPELFPLARCSLGTLGVVAEATLQCVPAHRLLERTWVADGKEVRRNHGKWQREHQHLRYMWIPHTDSVVVVASNPLPGNVEPPEESSPLPLGARLAHVRALYRERCALPQRGGAQEEAEAGEVTSEAKGGVWSGTGSAHAPQRQLVEEELQRLSFTQLRDELLALAPLECEHVERVNRAEERYWQLSSGTRVGWSDEILGFDCGGQQWVSEVCFPAARSPRGWWAHLWGREEQRDLDYMAALLRKIKEERIPAPAPIEQRWSAGSSSPLSPAHSPDPASIFSWVGIIMYLPTEDPGQRAAITGKFFEYKFSVARALWDEFGAHEHWAKLEVPADAETREWLKARLEQHFPLPLWRKWRSELDPKGILSNELLDELLPGALPAEAKGKAEKHVEGAPPSQ